MVMCYPNHLEKLKQIKNTNIMINIQDIKSMRNLQEGFKCRLIAI